MADNIPMIQIIVRSSMSVNALLIAFFIFEFLTVHTGTRTVFVAARSIINTNKGLALVKLTAIRLYVQLLKVLKEINGCGENVLESIILGLCSGVDLLKLTLDTPKNVEVVTGGFNCDHKRVEELRAESRK